MPTAPADPLVLLAAFVVFWFAGAAVMSRIAGWHRLSALYPAPLRTQGEQWRFASAVLGPASLPIRYRRCVRVFLTEQGLGLCLMFPFRFHSPPFLVPWAAITGSTVRQTRGTREVTLTLAGTDRQLMLAGELGEQVRARLPAAAASPPV